MTTIEYRNQLNDEYCIWHDKFQLWMRYICLCARAFGIVSSTSHFRSNFEWWCAHRTQRNDECVVYCGSTSWLCIWPDHCLGTHAQNAQSKEHRTIRELLRADSINYVLCAGISDVVASSMIYDDVVLLLLLLEGVIPNPATNWYAPVSRLIWWSKRSNLTHYYQFVARSIFHLWNF